MKKEDIGNLEITKYSLEELDGYPKIVIHQIKALNKQGEYIKFVKLKEVRKYLSEFEVKFKPLK